ncbi:MFS transporter [Micromonospora wenchangensis]|uniref:MFS transporter n=1 Tax=Micromonospora wenchangensis TaxID=1185415 RepID=A0A246RL64_9ACTN|nr:MFS transporter [Micromonospora wenchangensis]OWV06800.1 MFS transporter [Micromonospora wenchangensis]
MSGQPGSDLLARLERLPLSRPHLTLLAMGGLGLTFDGLDVATVAFVLPSVTEEWQLSSGQTGLVGSSTLIGFFFGALGAGIIADRIGRRRVMMWALAVFCLATLVAAVSPSWEFFFLARLVAGIGTGAESAIIPAFLSEFVPGRLRGRFIGALAGFFSFGYVGAALLARWIVPMGPEGWRVLHVVATVPIVLLLWWRRSVPESPRFLLARGRTDEARAVVETIERQAARSAATRPPSPAAPSPTVTPADPAPGTAPPPRVGIGGLWRRDLAGRTAVLWVLWVVITFSFYGFFTFIPTLLYADGLTIAKSFTYSIVIYLAQIPGYYSAAALNDLLDRKWTIALYLGGGSVAAYLLSGSDISAQVMIFGGLLSFFMNGVYAAIYAYTPELYPTAVRARGMGTASAVGRIGGISAPILIGTTYPVIGFDGVFLVTTGVLAVGVVVVLAFGVSTSGRALEEISDSGSATVPAPDGPAPVVPGNRTVTGARGPVAVGREGRSPRVDPS